MVEQTQDSTAGSSPESAFEDQSGLKVTPPMIESLRATKPWAKLLAILGFVAGAFTVFGGIFILIGHSRMPHHAQGGPFPFFLIPLLNILLGLLYFIPSYLLLKYAVSIGQLLAGGGQPSMEQALSYQKSFWKFAGIFGLIAMGLTLLGMAAAIIIPLFARFVH